MRRRGLRLEVDEPTERQRRNQRWLAANPLTTAVVGALLFGGMGAALAAVQDLSLALGVLIGVLVGGALGWAFSVSYRDAAPKGVTRAVYVGALAVGAVALAGLKVL